jgi:hypothetical protein
MLRHRRLGALLLGGVALGCTAVLGIEQKDFVEPDAAAGGSTATGGNGGSSGSSPSGGTAGSASGGTAGSASGGTAGSASGGTAGSASGGTAGAGGCSAGLTPCNSKCVDLTKDSANCGSCGSACAVGATCKVSQCICPAGQNDCNGKCVDLQSDVSNCQSCGNDCLTKPKVTAATCTAGACKVITCGPDTGDCDGDGDTGCEADLLGTANCGSCGNNCGSTPNGTFTCVGGTCALTCTTGTQCGGACVALSSDPNNCGQCGTVCSSLPNVASATCSANKCVLNCQTGYQDCNGNPGDGCETGVMANNNNCGQCGLACAGTQQCSNGVCI